jgi:type III secretion protein D
MIARLGLNARVTLDVSKPQRPVARAVFLSEQETEALAQVLSRRTPAAHLELIEEAQAVEQVVRQVQRVAEPLGAKLSVRHLGGGRFRVEGQVADESQRTQIATDLKDLLPQVTEFEFAMQARSELANAMLSELKRLGIGQLQGGWREGVLVIDARLPPGGVPQWERALLAAAERYEVPFRATVVGGEATAGSSSALSPFTVRSVVSTPQPYVILSDGTKLVPGAQIAGWHLVEIDRQGVRFKGPEGQTITVER